MLNFIQTLSSRQKRYVLLSVDLLLVPLALLFTYAVQALPVSARDSFVQSLPVLPYLILAMAGVSIWLGLPNISLNLYEHHAMGLTALLALALMGLSAGLSYLAGMDLLPGTHVILGLSYFLFAVGSRIGLYHLVTWMYRKAQSRCRVLIYGAGTTGAQLVQALRVHDTIDPVAFVDDNTALQGVSLSGLSVFSPARIGELVVRRSIKRVLLAMPSQSRPKQAQIIRRLQKMGLEVQALPSFAQLIGEEALLDKLTAVPSRTFLGRPVCDVALAEACDSYVGRVVLVTGAGGSIGSELCRQLLSCHPARLVLFDLSELALYTVHQELEQLAEGTGVELVPVLGSVTDACQVRRVMQDQQVQVVLHAAAYKHVPLVEANPLPGLSNNVLGTEVLARAAAEAKVERFILVSSDKAVNPTNVMGASKRLAELVEQDIASRNTGTVFAMVRFGNVLGSSGSVVPLFQDQISRGGPVTVTDEAVKRYFMTSTEAVQLVLQAGAEAVGGELFVLDMGAPVRIVHLARQVIESAGYTVRDASNPGGDIAIKITGLRPGEKLEEELTLCRELTTTRHAKIFCAREAGLSEIEVAAMLRGLRQALADSDENAARQIIRHWVEGYHQPKAGSAKVGVGAGSGAGSGTGAPRR